jgi:hypothetical protein
MATLKVVTASDPFRVEAMFSPTCSLRRAAAPPQLRLSEQPKPASHFAFAYMTSGQTDCWAMRP